MSRLTSTVVRLLVPGFLVAGLSACDKSPTAPAPHTLLAVTHGTEVGIVHLDGSGYTRLVGPELCAATVEPCTDPTWTPDGKAILFSVATRDEHGLHMHLHLVDRSGNVRRLVPDGGVLQEEVWGRVSPDGQWVYVTGRPVGDEGYGVWRVALDGSGATRVGPPPVAFGLGTDRVFGVSPDGRRVLVETPRPGIQTLATLDLATGTLTNISLSGPSVAWSPVDDRIAVIAWEHNRLLIESSSGTSIREVLNAGGAGGFSTGLAWSPDGAFVLVRGNGTWYSVDPDTGKQTVLSPGLAEYGEIAVSPTP